MFYGDAYALQKRRFFSRSFADSFVFSVCFSAQYLFPHLWARREGKLFGLAFVQYSSARWYALPMGSHGLIAWSAFHARTSSNSNQKSLGKWLGRTKLREPDILRLHMLHTTIHIICQARSTHTQILVVVLNESPHVWVCLRTKKESTRIWILDSSGMQMDWGSAMPEIQVFNRLKKESTPLN